MREEYEKLYTEFLKSQIKTLKEKQALKIQLKRIGVI